MKTNLELYQQRNEPEILRQDSIYANLRTSQNLDLIRSLESILKELSNNSREKYVLASWISPPFGRIAGYGVYTKKEAQELNARSKNERWGFPRFGSIYDISRLERKIESLKSKGSHLLPSPSY